MHTKGKWEVFGGCSVKGPNGNTVAECVGYSDKATDPAQKAQGGRESNARLIAAAPAMLEACEQVSEWLDFLKINYPDMPGLIRGVRAARAAIAQTES